MKVISFDVMGNDNGVKECVIASNFFAKQNPEYKLILVGSAKEINQHLKARKNIEVVDVPKIADVQKGIMVIREKDTSMFKAIEMVKDKKSSAVLSCGSSAGYIAYSSLVLKKLKGISRPAFMPILPTVKKGKHFIMMDVGANLEVNGDMLYQWSKIGNIFAKKILDINNPRIGILNIGTEEKKGLSHHKEAYDILSKDNDLNFQGYIEPKKIFSELIDVVITDGYAGNVCLKTIEGTTKAFSGMLKRLLKTNPVRIFGSILSRGAFKSLKSIMSFRKVGGAWVIGLDGIAIKAHGNSDTIAIIGALNQIKKAIDNNTMKIIKAAVE